MTGAGSVEAAPPADPRAVGNAIPTPALRDLRVRPILFRIAKSIVVGNRYLGTMPGGTRLALGVFVGKRLLGVVIFGVGPSNIYHLAGGAEPDDCMTLARVWLSDLLLANSESRVIGVTLRALKRETSVRFLVTYAGPAAGHVGTHYQAADGLYTGLSQAMPLIDVGDGVPPPSRSLTHAYGTHSHAHFAAYGVDVKPVPQAPKHRYVYLLDPSWRPRLRVSTLPYLKRGDPGEGR